MRRRRFTRVLLAVLLVLAALAAVAYVKLLRSRFPDPPARADDARRDTLTLQDRERTYVYYAPATLAPSPALVFVLHGGVSSAEETRRYTAWEFEARADEAGFIVVYPEALGAAWHVCRTQLPSEARSQGIDDVAFVARLVDRFAASHNADREPVFVAGFSNGAGMGMRLALEAPEGVRALAAVAMHLPAPDNFDCQRAETPVPFLLMSGTADPIVPYAGGPTSFFGRSHGDVLSADDTVAYFRELAGYAPDDAQLEVLPDAAPDDESTVERRIWRADGRPEILQYTVRGGGHNIPHPDVRFGAIVGPTNNDINGPREILAFFERAGL